MSTFNEGSSAKSLDRSADRQGNRIEVVVRVQQQNTARRFLCVDRALLDDQNCKTDNKNSKRKKYRTYRSNASWRLYPSVTGSYPSF
jgi:hypothetical protein